jgi:branched-chain amino acid transport system substrate-binding protein
MMKKLLLSLLCISLLCSCQKKTSEANSQDNRPEVKIGFALPLSGSGLSFTAEDIRNSALMAIEKIPLNSKYHYKVIFEDTQGTSKGAALAINKLIQIDKTDILFTLYDNDGKIAVPLANQTKTIHFSTSWDPANLEGDYNFIMWPPIQSEIKAFVEELKTRNIQKVSIFYLNQSGWMRGIKIFEELCKKSHIQIVNSHKLNPGDKDFRLLSNQIKKSNSEAVILFAWPPEIEIIAKQVKDAGITAPMLSVEAFDSAENLSQFNGGWYLSLANTPDTFSTAYTNHYKKTPSFVAPFGYDTVTLVTQAYEEHPSSTKPSSGEIAASLYNKTNTNGLLFKKVSKEGFILADLAIKKIENGKSIQEKVITINEDTIKTEK